MDEIIQIAIDNVNLTSNQLDYIFAHLNKKKGQSTKQLEEMYLKLAEQLFSTFEQISDKEKPGKARTVLDILITHDKSNRFKPIIYDCMHILFYGKPISGSLREYRFEDFFSKEALPKLMQLVTADHSLIEYVKYAYKQAKLNTQFTFTWEQMIIDQICNHADRTLIRLLFKTCRLNLADLITSQVPQNEWNTATKLVEYSTLLFPGNESRFAGY